MNWLGTHAFTHGMQHKYRDHPRHYALLLAVVVLFAVLFFAHAAATPADEPEHFGGFTIKNTSLAYRQR